MKANDIWEDMVHRIVSAYKTGSIDYLLDEVANAEELVEEATKERSLSTCTPTN